MTATDGAYGHERGRLMRLAVLIGHYSLTWETPLYVVVWAAIIGSWWLREGSLTSDLLSNSGAAVAIGFGVAITCQIIHDRQLCLRDVDSTPMFDPQAAVDKYRPLLRYCHNSARQRSVLLVSAAPIAILFLPRSLYVDSPLLKAILTAVAVVGIAALSYSTHAIHVHRRMTPWCPWCRGGDGDDDHTKVPTPDPAGVGNH